MKRKNYVCLLLAFVLIGVTACKKKTVTNGPGPTVPQLTTTNVSNITTNAAVSGGTITSDGGAPIIASGICYSKTNPVPNIANDTTKGTVASGSFTANLRNLQPDVTYYVRAYAINSVGIAYGNVVQFNSSAFPPNFPPEARDITILGTVQVAYMILVRFTFFDAENDPALPATFQWYVADDSTMAGTPITGATDSTLSITPAHLGKFLKVVVTPRAMTGSGTPTSSRWVGPVAQGEIVTFNYNGQSVTYGVITSAKTGRKFLDRNLGAPNAATAFNDWQNMGDLFQWGRGADGHQLIIRRPGTLTNAGVHGSTATLSAVDNPGHFQFITTPGTLPGNNWREPYKSDLWLVSGGVNNVCPAGWHVPSRQEWQDEEVGTREQGYTKLKLTAAGIRNYGGFVVDVALRGNYWSSTALRVTDSIMFAWSLHMPATDTSRMEVDNFPGAGLSVRCIKD